MKCAIALAFGIALMAPSTAGAAPSLQWQIDSAPPGGEVVVAGVHEGGVVIRRPLRLVGLQGAVIDGNGYGTVIRIEAPNVVVRGLTLRNSGSDLNTEDAGVYVGARGVLLEDLQLEQVLFGLNLKQAHGTVVRRVSMEGQDLALSRRGDAVRLWYSHRVALTQVRVRRMRDVLVWFSRDSVLHVVDVGGSRYGVHLMYGERTAVLASRFERNAVGAYVMYSTGIRMEGNRFVHHRGATGVGLAIKESDDVVVRGNLIAANKTGLYVDGSPQQPEARGEITDNIVAGNDTGLVLLSNADRNVIAGNVFDGNGEQVRVAGGGRSDNIWQRAGLGNYWDDYAGLDGDRDGAGDAPYRARRWFEGLGDRLPESRFLWGSPAVAAVDFAARLVPMFAAEVLAEDPRPLMVRHIPTEFQGNAASGGFALASLGLLAAGLWALQRGMRRRMFARQRAA